MRVAALVSAVCSAGLVLALAGCGTGGYTDGGSQGNGKQLFTQACGVCHTLADAGTAGTIGPNLDDAFAQARTDGMTSDTFTQVVAAQIQFPIEMTSTGAPGMPAVDQTLPSCDDVEEGAFCVDGPGPGRGRYRGLRRIRCGHGRDDRSADGREVDLHRELRVLSHAGGRGHCRHDRAEPGRGEAAEGPRRRSRDERTGRHAVIQGLARSGADRRRRRVRLEAQREAKPPRQRSRSTTTCVSGTS